jgi:uncharacterized protein YndB with AHSA1/START domain
VSTTRPPLIFQSKIGAPPEVVWQAFFHQPQRWLCRDASVQPEAGGALRLCWPDGCIEGRFVQCDPPNTGRFSWRFEGDSLPETMVVVHADPGADDGTTALEVEHYGFGVGPDWDMLYVGAARAWAAYLKNLRAVLEAGIDLREPDE